MQEKTLLFTLHVHSCRLSETELFQSPLRG